MSDRIPPRPDRPPVWPSDVRPILILTVVLNGLFIPLIISEVHNPNAGIDSAGMMTVSLVYMDLILFVMWVIAASSRAKRWYRARRNRWEM